LALFNVRWLREETEPAAPFISLVVERILRKEEESARRMASLVFFSVWPLYDVLLLLFFCCLQKTNNSHTHATRTPHKKNNCALLYKFLENGTGRVHKEPTISSPPQRRRKRHNNSSLSETFAIERHQISGLCRYVITHHWKLHSASRRRRQTPPHSQEFSKTPPNVDSCFYYETRNRSTHIVQQNAAKRAHRAFPKAIR